MRVGILAGEASGDILGSRLLSALRRRYPDLQVEGIGGPLMQAQGLHSLFPMDRLSVMGFVEPLKRLPELLRIRRSVYQHFLANPPDVFIGIDSPDFCLRLEARLRRAGIKTVHLVSPSVWAWRQGRIRTIRRAVDRMLCLFPFETAIYHQHGIGADFVGHPLADEIPLFTEREHARRALGLAEEGRLLALLPGSRSGEVAALTPLFLEVARRLAAADPELRFALPAANVEREAQIASLLQQAPNLPLTLVQGRSRDVMAAADAVLLASGTATLEALLVQRPMAVAYRMAPLSWALVSRLVRIPFAALPNILAGRALVPEL
ncbi:MAG TPA: lipid-A-disaccharide synthase, partial [Halieaceae bacterium]|nr:lipid-A-disaccharide synthase [Halieaceae bacterium]